MCKACCFNRLYSVGAIYVCFCSFVISFTCMHLWFGGVYFKDTCIHVFVYSHRGTLAGESLFFPSLSHSMLMTQLHLPLKSPGTVTTRLESFTEIKSRLIISSSLTRTMLRSSLLVPVNRELLFLINRVFMYVIYEESGHNV